MELILNDEITFNKPLLGDIINDIQCAEGETVLQFTGKHSLILYAVVKQSVYMELAQNKEIKEPLVFYEYNWKKPLKGDVVIRAEVNIENALDMLKPGVVEQIRNYEKLCLNNNLVFKNEHELISMYMSTHKLQLIRECEALNLTLGTTYAIRYKVIDIKCIKRLELMNKHK